VRPYGVGKRCKNCYGLNFDINVKKLESLSLQPDAEWNWHVNTHSSKRTTFRCVLQAFKGIRIGRAAGEGRKSC
jgi:hypothetical protein